MNALKSRSSSRPFSSWCCPSSGRPSRLQTVSCEASKFSSTRPHVPHSAARAYSRAHYCKVDAMKNELCVLQETSMCLQGSLAEEWRRLGESCRRWRKPVCHRRRAEDFSGSGATTIASEGGLPCAVAQHPRGCHPQVKMPL